MFNTALKKRKFIQCNIKQDKWRLNANKNRFIFIDVFAYKSVTFISRYLEIKNQRFYIVVY